MNKNAKKKKKGFTLIELIIVLAIMAIIAAIAIPNFSAVRDNSKKKADTQSCETIKRTVLMLVSDSTLAPQNNADVAKPKTLTFTAGSDFTTTATSASLSGTGNSFDGDNTWSDTEKLETAKALKEVKTPQQAGAHYVVKINKSGEVAVTLE
ncbi:prepilin-type N-terminal cleavage/methylation domain-containing protein [Clostridium omnivorum]|uniref:Prepilin-type N-terminal cleavage/methylation domain-containing protein n=1 Tax=Clostridium omnivorum TaxID=1604902 RepID=A0ABQ5N8E3_9CLOT|nr:prepilin-type N-terminal cleavage/methylation domain-containing protein [Clostridium sp. E14]GLC31401.1 hypothetical protein bsdE14_28110 [Clostridium sp. E14]